MQTSTGRGRKSSNYFKMLNETFFFFFPFVLVVLFLAVLGIEPRDSHLLGKFLLNFLIGVMAKKSLTSLKKNSLQTLLGGKADLR